MQEIDDSKAPIVAHLSELRRRLVYSLLALIGGFILCFPFAADIFDFLVAPLQSAWEGQAGRRIIYTALHEKFFVDIKLAFFAGFCLTFPLLISQIWAFIAPGLYKHEKHAFAPFLIATPVLFIMGASFVYYLVMPVAVDFFLGSEQIATADNLAIELEPKANEYLGLIMRLIFAFGLSFELPVLLILLVRVGLATEEGLRKKRRYAILLAFVAAAILTPPDPLSQIGLAVPIIILYEVSIFVARLIEKQRRARAENVPDESENP